LDDARLHHKRMVSFSIRDAAFWSEIIENFNNLYPEIYIRQMDNDPDDYGKIMERLDLDFIITDKDLNNDKFASCVLFDDYLVLAVPKTHPLTTKDSKPRSLFEFRDDTFLFRPKGDYFQQCVDHLLLQIGFKPLKAMEFDYVLRSLVLARGFGVVITTEQTARTRLYQHASVVRIKEFEGIPQTKKLYWKKHTSVSPSAIVFREYLKAATKLIAAQATAQTATGVRRENNGMERGADQTVYAP
jgi:DNA-binding transcriptional LysR family regulator